MRYYVVMETPTVTFYYSFKLFRFIHKLTNECYTGDYNLACRMCVEPNTRVITKLQCKAKIAS